MEPVPVTLTELDKSGERLRTFIESVPNGIVMVDSQARIILCNSETERMFGYSKGELNGEKVEKLVPIRYRDNHPKYRSEFIQEPHKRQMGAGRDLTGLRSDGTEIPVEIGLNPMYTPEGVYVLATIVDITERKKIEQKLQNAYAEVQQKNIEMEQFVYTVSHDLKSPLVTSTAFLGFIKEDLQANRLTEVADSLERLEKAHRKMQALIDDLLQLSRAGRMELHIEELPLNGLLEVLSEDFSQRLHEVGARLEIAPNLPTVLADRRRISQVFENLLSNAIKYASGQAHATFKIFAVENESEYQICVKDNGPGILPEYHSKIFALFQRLNVDKEGTGVGLTIVSRIMQLHGGRVWIVSDVGQGAEFWLAFPKVVLSPRGSYEH